MRPQGLRRLWRSSSGCIRIDWISRQKYVCGKSFNCCHVLKCLGNGARARARQKKYPRIMERGIRTIKVDWKQEMGLCGVPKEKALKTLEMCNLDCFTCAHSEVTMGM